ncbi:TrkH family potassium uptake protein [Thalassobius sp. Cn5-15]|uniref:TrkH family potassium uptake protein n=1 Tax=Thalassobius sp. Cn5-15 TaxID=2917763 RepID=UPI001EF3C7C1|nr:potassium transporter TrkG [Thalassobius sp. Cn5-15]MCG7492189.1 TrkH family potassium uptake protein [Thalassobius sp. Cn5-15]
MWARIIRQPLFLLLMGLSALAMLVPAAHGFVLGRAFEGRAFLYSALLGVLAVVLVSIARDGVQRRRGAMGDLLALFAAMAVLPLFLALPFYEALRTTSFLNAYAEMVSSLTTTGAAFFPADRLSDTLHLWRGMVGWMGGALIWVAAAAILAPLNLGGFEVTASAEPGQSDQLHGRHERIDPQRRIIRAAKALLPIYAGLTFALWLMLMVIGDRPLVSMIHAMSIMASSGITPLASTSEAQSGVPGEAISALFMLFALSRLTFSADTITTSRRSLHEDPEFRLGMFIVIAVPLVLFLRHWVASYSADEEQSLLLALRALWGGVFTTLSFLTTTGFESVEWETARNWSGLPTPGLMLLGLAMMGGGVATTAGGVKLLRVWALYLNGLREMDRLVHPSSVGRAQGMSRRIRRQGAFIAWIFFMMFALSMALFTMVFAGFGSDLETALTLAIAGLSTTGPLVQIATDEAVNLVTLAPMAKLAFAAAMVLGRLEMLAFVALFTGQFLRR